MMAMKQALLVVVLTMHQHMIDAAIAVLFEEAVCN
jgi:hypothetical protein